MVLRTKAFIACIAILIVASTAPVVMAQDGHGHGHEHGGEGGVEGPVEFVRNVEEVKGHLNASLTLAREGDQEGASLHANHPPDDYVGVIVPEVEKEDSELATEIESTLEEAPEMAEGNTDEYADYIRNEVNPLLDEAVEAGVADEELDDATFGARVNMELLERIDDEYTAAVAENSTVVLEGEYWDGRGFLSRIESRHPEVAVGFEGDEGANSEIEAGLGKLRSEYEERVPPSELKPTTLRLRVLYEAAAGTDDAVIDDEVEAVRFMRNAEEVKGHLESSIILKGEADSDGASLHAGHPTDYIQALGPATYTADEATYETLSEVSYATSDRVASDSTQEYESYVSDEVFPAIDSSVETAVPEQHRTTETRAQVAAELIDRLVEEYSAAVTEDGTVELEGEYWDGRGFLVRITEMHEAELSDEMSGEMNEELSNALGDLRSSYEDEVPPSELEPAAGEVRTVLTDAEFGASEGGEAGEGAEEEEGEGESEGEEEDSTDGDGDGESEEDSTEEEQETEQSNGGDESTSDGDGSGDETDSEGDGDGQDQGMPGFTAVAALFALFVVVAVFLRE